MPKDKISRLFFIVAVTLFLAGLIFRILSFGNLGFEFDTVTTQHEWAKSAIEFGFLNFWATYNKYLDYLPGAVFFDAVIKGISLIINNSPETFVLVLKIFNSIVDIAFIWHLGIFLHNHLQVTIHKVLVVVALLWALPALWIVSAFWGQFDNLIVLLLFISFVNLTTDFRFPWQQAGRLQVVRNCVWAGIFLGIAFTIKPQPLLFFPVFALYLAARKNKSQILGFLKGFSLTFFISNILPFLFNPARTQDVFFEVFSRGNVISKGASTFWTLFPGLHSPADVVISFGSINLSLSIVAISIFLLILVAAAFYLFRFKLHKPIHINFAQIILLVCLENLAYFLFMLGMHSRYAQFAVAYGLIPIFFLKNRLQKKIYLVIYTLYNLAYAFNQLSVYYYNYKDKVSLNLDNLIYDPLSSVAVSLIYLLMFFTLLASLRFFRSKNAEGES